MLEKYGIVPVVVQDPPLPVFPSTNGEVIWKKSENIAEVSEHFGKQFLTFLGPLLAQLDQTVDKRILRTMVQGIEAILSFRDRTQGLLLSELGGYLDGLGGGGGTKRLSRLLHHERWKAQQIDHFLLWRADQHFAQLEEQGQDSLLIWDATVLEKPESLSPEGLCAVLSSKAKRLTHYKKGYYRPPSAPIFVPGLHGIGLLLASRHKIGDAAQLAALRWWTSRGAFASWERDESCQLLRLTSQLWGTRLLHVFDRGYASSTWLGALRGFGVRFILRWPTKYHLVSADGTKQAVWKNGRGKRGLAPRTLFDAVHHKQVAGSVLFFPVTHPDLPDWPLTLVIGRRKGGKPWYLLTNEVVESAEDAWKVVLAYARRWQVEMAFRNVKSELAIQSLRVYAWETRRKLLGLVTLAYAFLMDLMSQPAKQARDWLITLACHRTGAHLREVDLPFTRLRIALSKLWLRAPCWFVRRAAFVL